LAFLEVPWVNVVEWLRLPGDALFILGGALPLVWLCWQAVRYPNPRRIEAETELPRALYTYETDKGK
jgi:nitric oxide reductase subunit B